MNEIKHTLVLATVDKVHEVLFSFLRTSDRGEWRTDPDEKSDPFILHFCRGKKAKKSGFFVSRTVAPSVAPRSIDMWLKVTPGGVRIRLLYSCKGYSSDHTKSRCEQAFEKVCVYVEEEINALAVYLKECFDLPEPPGVTCE